MYLAFLLYIIYLCSVEGASLLFVIRKDTKPVLATFVKLALRSPSARKLAALPDGGTPRKHTGPRASPPCLFSPSHANPQAPNNRRKMKTGRPHKPESETKDIVKHIRYSPDEWSRVEAKTSAIRSYFLRVCKTGHLLRERDAVPRYGADHHPPGVEGVARQSGKHINQIAKSGSMVTDSFSLERYLKELQNCKKEAEELSSILLQIRNALR
jgi:hypothetical protein